MQSVPTRIKWVYAIGQMGWSLAYFGVSNLISFFYMAPDDGGERAFPIFIYQGMFAGLTLIGIIGAFGRGIDAITDPLTGWLSDRSASQNWKRRKFMLIGLLPFTICSVLVFCPPVPTESMTNTWWLAITLIVFYIGMTLYVVPHTAMLSDLGRGKKDTLNIATIMALCWGFGYLIGAINFVLLDIVQQKFQLSNTQSLQIVLSVYAVIAFVLMLLPILFVNEKKYCISGQESVTPKQAFIGGFKIKNFRYFIFSDLNYWVALGFIMLGVPYYITILADLDKTVSTYFLAGVFIGSLILTYPANLLAKRFGKKRLHMGGYILFGLAFCFTFFLGDAPISSTAYLTIMALFAAFPLATFSLLPNAFLADIEEQHRNNSGEALAAILYANRYFVMKVGLGLANLLFPSLLLLGNSQDNDLGIRSTTVVAVFFCIIGCLIFARYKDQKEE